jgi:hypothetical protein
MLEKVQRERRMMRRSGLKMRKWKGQHSFGLAIGFRRNLRRS